MSINEINEVLALLETHEQAKAQNLATARKRLVLLQEASLKARALYKKLGSWESVDLLNKIEADMAIETKIIKSLE